MIVASATSRASSSRPILRAAPPRPRPAGARCRHRHRACGRGLSRGGRAVGPCGCDRLIPRHVREGPRASGPPRRRPEGQHRRRSRRAHCATIEALSTGLPASSTGCSKGPRSRKKDSSKARDETRSSAPFITLKAPEVGDGGAPVFWGARRHDGPDKCIADLSNPAEVVRRLCKRQCLSNKAFRSKTGCQVPHLPRREGVESGDGEPVLEGIALRTRFTPRRPRTSAPLGIAPIGRLLFGGSHRNALFRGFREFDVFYLSRPM